MLPQKTDIRKPEGKFFRLKDKAAEWKLCLQERTESTRHQTMCKRNQCFPLHLFKIHVTAESKNRNTEL